MPTAHELVAALSRIDAARRDTTIRTRAQQLLYTLRTTVRTEIEAHVPRQTRDTLWPSLQRLFDDLQHEISTHPSLTPIARQVEDLELAAHACTNLVHQDSLARSSQCGTGVPPVSSALPPAAPSFSALVASELIDARIAHPKPHNSLHEAYAVLLEEVDELWEQVRGKRRDANRVLSELVQIAAVCQRAAEDLNLPATAARQIAERDYPSD